jgi:hypothetical protein
LALTGGGFSGIASQALLANYFDDTLTISLTSPANALGFDAYSYGEAATVTISVFDTEGGMIGNATIAAGFPAANFFGVISDSGPIGRVLLDTGGSAEGVDNVAFGLIGEVPEPGTVGLLASGLLALFAWRRRAAR